MTARGLSPDRSDEPIGAAGSRRITRLAGRVLLLTFVVGSVVMWSYGLWGPRHDPPGTLTGRGFPAAAEDACADVVATIEALPPAQEAGTPQERAAVIRQADEALTGLLAELREIAPVEGQDAEMVALWLDDWQRFLADRRAYADTLAGGEDSRFVESEKEGDHISEALAFFAEINEMPSCAPPEDV